MIFYDLTESGVSIHSEMFEALGQRCSTFRHGADTLFHQVLEVNRQIQDRNPKQLTA